MGCQTNSLFYFFFFFFLLTGFAYSSSFISYDALDPQGHPGRTLLQAKKVCNVSFENLDYSTITSKCKGPQYPPKVCCAALAEFACPFSDEVNDRTNNCAETMFSYLNLYGKYPPGLFANQCKGDQDGLSCDNVQNSTSTSLQFGPLQSSMATFGILAQDNVMFLHKWLLQYPEYKNKNFFIIWESYAGHYVPQLAKLIVESGLLLNLKGIAIGNPLVKFNTDINSQGDYYRILLVEYQFF